MRDDDFISAAPPPPGVIPSFENPSESLVPQVLTVAIFLNLLAIIFCAIRLYTARVVVRRRQIDDDLIFIALIFASTYSVIQVYETRNGAGHHIWDVTKANAMSFYKFSTTDLVAYSLSILFTKASILVFYLRFPLKQRVRIVVYVVMIITLVYSAAGALGWVYLCTPINKIWEPEVPGNCIDRATWWLILSACNVATDLAILLLPIWILSSLSIRLLKKIEMTIFLMAGGFVLGPSVARLVMITMGLHNPDFTWSASINIIWCIAEANVGIICTCVPFFKAFTRHVFPSIAKKLAMNDNEPNSQTVFDKVAAMASLPPIPRSTRRKSLGRQAVNDVPDSELDEKKHSWPSKKEVSFDVAEDHRLSLDRVSSDSKLPQKPVDVAEMV